MMEWQAARIVSVDDPADGWALGRSLWVEAGPPRIESLIGDDRGGRAQRNALVYYTHLPRGDWMELVGVKASCSRPMIRWALSRCARR